MIFTTLGSIACPMNRNGSIIQKQTYGPEANMEKLPVAYLDLPIGDSRGPRYLEEPNRGYLNLSVENKELAGTLGATWR